MRVLFVALFNIAEVYLAIAKELEAGSESIKVYWYVSDSIRYRQLLDAGVSNDRILKFYQDGCLLDQNSLEGRLTIAELAKAETKGSRTLAMDLLGDRFVNDKRDEKVFNQALFQFRGTKEFLELNAIDVVFGEPTNRDVLMIALVCEYLGVRFLFPQDARYPHDHFFFQQGVSTSRIIKGGNTNCFKLASDLIDEFNSTPIPPKSYAVISGRLSPLNLLQKFKNRILRVVTRNDSLVHHSFVKKLKEYSLAIVRTSYLSYFQRYDIVSETDVRYVYYPLHVQPELSIDVLAPYHLNQEKLITDIAISLPSDMKLVIKEHPNFIGQKSIKFFKSLRKLPNVLLIDHNARSFDLIKNAEIVFTVSGTAALEAALLSVPSVTFCDVYFNNISSVHSCHAIEELKEHIRSIQEDFQFSAKKNLEDFKTLLGDFYAGYWTDADSDGDVLDQCNISKLAFAFSDVIWNSDDY
jgi:hypothetical protein